MHRRHDMAATPLRPLSCLALVTLACAAPEPPRAADSPNERGAARAAIISPTLRQRSPAEPPHASLTGPTTELTPASGTLPPADLAPKTALARAPDVLYVPTPQPVVERMLQMAQVSKNDVVYDLGCGDGRIVVTAAKLYGARAYGFDIDPKRVAEARANVEAASVAHLVTIEHRDIFTVDLSPASVVTLYLLPQLNVRLIPQLEKLQPGSRIVSHDFNIEGVTPLQQVTLQPPGEAEHAIYLWKTPLERGLRARQ